MGASFTASPWHTINCLVKATQNATPPIIFVKDENRGSEKGARPHVNSA